MRGRPTPVSAPSPLAGVHNRAGSGRRPILALHLMPASTPFVSAFTAEGGPTSRPRHGIAGAGETESVAARTNKRAAGMTAHDPLLAGDAG